MTSERSKRRDFFVLVFISKSLYNLSKNILENVSKFNKYLYSGLNKNKSIIHNAKTTGRD